MRSRVTSLVAAVLVCGCGGGAVLYPDTDIVQVQGFDLSRATNLQMGGGVLQSGTLEYKGSGDLQHVFHGYCEAMSAAGWTSINRDIVGEKAVGTLRKDSRTAAVEFSSTGGTILAVIKIGPTAK